MKPSNLMHPPVKCIRKHKYNATSCYADGIYFPSKHEAKWYERLKIMVKMGEIVRFHRQVIFDLGGGTTAKIDFQLIYPDGRVEYWDAKGKRTASFIRNQKQIKAFYNVDIKEV